jgi:hypothetical protein
MTWLRFMPSSTMRAVSVVAAIAGPANTDDAKNPSNNARIQSLPCAADKRKPPAR